MEKFKGEIMGEKVFDKDREKGKKAKERHISFTVQNIGDFLD